MAHEAVNVRAVSNLQSPMQVSRHQVNLKTKQTLVQSINQRIQRGLRPGQKMQIMGNTDARPVILDRYDSLEQLNYKF